jgi:hypothetical protein
MQGVRTPAGFADNRVSALRSDSPQAHRGDTLVMPTSSYPHDEPDRRANRLIIPHCERCGSSKTWVIGRTDDLLYVRCWDCPHGRWLPMLGAEAPKG